ncbi:MAG: hypothetical protein FWE15_09745 [Actinomycetia bacterium]|nr:hypothetical protein [Actinomycetes bacterium]
MSRFPEPSPFPGTPGPAESSPFPGSSGFADSSGVPVLRRDAAVRDGGAAPSVVVGGSGFWSASADRAAAARLRGLRAPSGEPVEVLPGPPGLPALPAEVSLEPAVSPGRAGGGSSA